MLTNGVGYAYGGVDTQRRDTAISAFRESSSPPHGKQTVLVGRVPTRHGFAPVTAESM